MASCCRGSGSKDSFEDEGTHPSASKTSVKNSPQNKGERSSIFGCRGSGSGLSKDYEELQFAFYALTAHFAKIQFRLRQILSAQPSERDRLLADLVTIATCEVEEFKQDALPRMKKDVLCLGNIRKRQGYLIQRLRQRMHFLCEHSVPPITEGSTESMVSDVQSQQKLKKSSSAGSKA